MKLFLSWSGEVSKKVANTFRDWIPNVIQLVSPYLSAEDIEKGARWSANIAKELEDSHYGIIIVTKDNMHAPWINFEAGALSKSIEKAYVTPFLFDLKNSELEGPLIQFQSTLNEKEDLGRLVRSINNRMPEGQRLREQQVEKAFDVWYPQLRIALQEIEKTSTDSNTGTKKAHKSQADVLEEVITQQRMLNQQSQMNSDTMRTMFSHMQDNTAKMFKELQMLIRRTRDSVFTKKIPNIHGIILRLERSIEQAQAAGNSDFSEILSHTKLLHEIVHSADRYSDERTDREIFERVFRPSVGREEIKFRRPTVQRPEDETAKGRS